MPRFTSPLPSSALSVSCDRPAVAPDSSRYLKVVVLSLCGHTNADTATGQNTRGGRGAVVARYVGHGGWGGERWEDSLKRICFGMFYFGRALGASGCWSRFLTVAAWVKG